MRYLFLVAVLVLSGCASTRRHAYVDQHPETQYSQEILKGQVVIGMIGDEVRASFGRPYRKSAIQGKIRLETWTYGHKGMYGIFRPSLSFFLRQCITSLCPTQKFHGHVTGWKEW